ncbi:MAG: ribosome biogenesis GTPase Der [Deltaproteobacteria bacterium]|nr:ribosome biogenesis GTPase Der [Deltaproteobacteria bacterium]
MKQVIAIIGRPNVGKSTLFNRLSEKHKAIVIDEPGATRDRNYADCTWYDKEFILIDTGGFEPVSTEKILIQMREQTALAMEEADIIIFLMDGRDGLTPSDKEITNILRQIKKPVFFAVNKIDGLKHENLAYEFYQLGIETLYPLSAQHGGGMYELMDDVAKCLPGTDETDQTPEERLRIAVIDTAGIRRKSRITRVLEKYSIVQALKAVNRCDIALLLIDAEEGMTEQDAKIAGLIIERGTACILVINKWDVIEKDNASVGNYVKDIKDKVKFMDYAPIIFVSALTGQRVLRIFDIIETVYQQYTKRVPTSDLNRVVREIIESRPPPRHQNKANPFSFMTQASVAPPTFIFFVREPKAVHFSYQRFLTNRIREAFGFDQVPIRMIFRNKHR